MSKNAEKIAIQNVEERIYNEIQSLLKWVFNFCNI
jgi:hypothetical protein